MYVRRVTLSLDDRADRAIDVFVARGGATNQTEAINRLCAVAGALLRYADAQGELVVLDRDGNPVRLLVV